MGAIKNIPNIINKTKDKNETFLRSDHFRSTFERMQARDVVIKYMKATNVPPINKLFTNQFPGNIKLTKAECDKAKAQSAKYNPKGA